MSEKSYGPVSLTIGHFSYYCDYQIAQYCCFMPPCRRQMFLSIDILHMLIIFHTKDNHQIVKFT